MTYKNWISNVDRVMVSAFGLAHDDLPDALWRDRFDDGMQPEEAITAAVDDEWADMPEMGDIWYG